MTENRNSTPDDDRFLARVLEWLRLDPKRQDVVAVESVTGHGTDWDGDTEGGFYSSFHVTIKWRDENGLERVERFEGEDLASLWSFVVGGYG